MVAFKALVLWISFELFHLNMQVSIWTWIAAHSQIENQTDFYCLQIYIKKSPPPKMLFSHFPIFFFFFNTPDIKDIITPVNRKTPFCCFNKKPCKIWIITRFFHYKNINTKITTHHFSFKKMIFGCYRAHGTIFMQCGC